MKKLCSTCKTTESFDWYGEKRWWGWKYWCGKCYFAKCNADFKAAGINHSVKYKEQ